MATPPHDGVIGAFYRILESVELAAARRDTTAQRGWLVRRGRTVMDGTIQRLPFLDRQQDVTRHLGHRSCQHEGIKHPPGNDAVERQTALQALVGGQWARFEATATLQNP